ncbi:uncharacterized protein LOC102452186 isoform X2 [Pelodiscus sinensis]|uniref:uncharacterized protein LOC102452186 isoform X2 n=1 Tax=Pelodiscus sinensis TaxID=13735 RepID=UPI0003C435B7|nr:uncharacterized protein LOC102452186 [Pelodiscus sinensis]|eukprot:XP_025043785.1 uncharacterized protein LOC102452186 [Pelodiscus sinensis]
MILRPRSRKPYKEKRRKRLMKNSKNKQKKLTAMQTSVSLATKSVHPVIPKSIEHQKRKKCYILTRDSKTVRFDLDEDGHCKISIEDSQSPEDIAWLDIFKSNKPNDLDRKKRGRNLVTMTQRSKNNFVLLGKDKKQLYLKVLNPNGIESVTEESKDVPDPKQLTEQSQEDQLFIMHKNEENSVKFQCYQDKNYYLHVNKDSVDICRMKETDASGGKDFDFKVIYVSSPQNKPTQNRK